MIIALLEDEESIADLVRLWLTSAGYRMQHYATVAAFRQSAAVRLADLVIIDRMLPDGDGIDAVKWFHTEVAPGAPVIFASALDSEQDIVAGLDAGAEDYLVKPLRREELLARVRVLARRIGRSPRGAIVCGAVTLDAANRRASVNGMPVALTDREFEVAAYLLRHRGRLVSRAELLKQVWRTSSALETRTVDTHVSRVRHKLQLQPAHGFSLEAVYNHGYRLRHAGDPAPAKG